MISPSLRRPAIAVIAATALVACGGATATETAGDDVGAPEATTELRLAIGGESEEGYDPTLGWGRYGSPLFQSTLLARDANLEVVNDLATGYSVSDDGLTWTVTIRDDAEFTDGEPLTAADVAYTFTTASQQGGLTDVTALEKAIAVDDTTVEFRLDEPRSTFLSRLVSLGIVPEHAHDDSYAQHPIGSGPFEFVNWERGQQLIVERNDDYYGKRPAFERIVFLFADEDGALAAARTGDVELAGLPSSLATADIDGMRLVTVESVDNRGIAFPMLPDTGKTTDAGRPIGNDVTADPAIRRAINVAVDRDTLVEGVLEGHGRPATGPADGTPWAHPDTGIDDADPDAAAAILDEAGWDDTDGDGVRERNGVTAAFNLWYPASDSLRQGLSLAVADMVEPIGIEVTAKGGSWEELDQHLHTDALLLGWGSHDPTEIYNLYHSSMAGVGYFNPGYYDSAPVDEHLDAAMTATDEQAANAAWQAAQLDGDGEGFTADAAWAWLVNLDHTYLVDECLDIGTPQPEPHGHGWPITAGITEWTWTC